MRTTLRFIFRGERIELASFDASLTLLDWLREHKRATGTKEGCNEGDCGACTVVLARSEAEKVIYTPVNACILLLGQVDGAELLTIEDLSPHGSASGGGLHPIQTAMIRHHGAQCGFCTPGIVMSLFAAYHAMPRPITRDSVESCLQGNLCRCTGYRPILDAALEALTEPADDAFSRNAAEHLSRLETLGDSDDVFVGDSTRFFAAPAHLDTLADQMLRYPEATLIAGATDVGIWITKRLTDLRKIIWLGRVEALKTIEDRGDTLFIGAGVTLNGVEQALSALDPDLGSLMQRFGSAQVRASGTIGGNIANGSPIGDLAPALIALGATLHLRRGGLTRRMPLEAFFVRYGQQERDKGEFVLGVSIPKLIDSQQFRAFKITKRADEDISAVMGAFRFEVEGGQIMGARIAYGGMAGTPKRASKTETALKGLSLHDSEALDHAIAMLEHDFQPLSDMRASAAYRMKVARAILSKAMLEIAGAATPTRIRAREDHHAAS